TIESIRSAAIPSIANNWLVSALAERDGTTAKNALTAFGESPITFGSAENVLFNRLFVEGVIARITKNEDRARSAFIAARAEQEKIIKAQPNKGPAMSVLGVMLASVYAG